VTSRAPSPADLAAALEVAVGRFVAAARRFAAARWQSPVGSDRTVAAAMQALVTRLAELEHAVAIGTAPPPAAWRSPAAPPYPGALPDRLAVVGHDLVVALRAAPPEWQVWYAGGLVPVADLAAAALAAVEATAIAVRRGHDRW
jgi:hypothetical protein